MREVFNIFSFDSAVQVERSCYFTDYQFRRPRKAISINSIYDRLGKALCLALLFFDAFSGCDSTPYFFNYTKNQLYAIWMSCPIHEEVSWVFQLLSWLPNRFCIDTCAPILEKFISYVFTKNPDDGKNLNEVRLLQYSSSATLRFVTHPERVLEQRFHHFASLVLLEISHCMITHLQSNVLVSGIQFQPICTS